MLSSKNAIQDIMKQEEKIVRSALIGIVLLVMNQNAYSAMKDAKKQSLELAFAIESNNIRHLYLK